MLGTFLKSSVHWCLIFTARGVYSTLSEVEGYRGYVEELLCLETSLLDTKVNLKGLYV